MSQPVRESSNNKFFHEEGGNSSSSTKEHDDAQNLRRSTRERRQPDYLKDYEVQLNQYIVTSCFFLGMQNEEPTCYNKAKEYPKWEKAMQEEIESLKKNLTLELVPQTKKSRTGHLQMGVPTKEEIR